MTEEHHISWICVAGDHLTQRITLEPTGEPKANFTIGEVEWTVYAYCNLHGLWAVDIT
jgi:superoxide reductase